MELHFGSMDAWRPEFAAMGKTQGGGSGWTLMAWSPLRARLVNAWCADMPLTKVARQLGLK